MYVRWWDEFSTFFAGAVARILGSLLENHHLVGTDESCIEPARSEVGHDIHLAALESCLR